MALSMRCSAISRPPASHTAALTLMLSCCAFAKAPRRMRLASSSVRLMAFLRSRETVIFLAAPTIESRPPLRQSDIGAAARSEESEAAERAARREEPQRVEPGEQQECTRGGGQREA